MSLSSHSDYSTEWLARDENNRKTPLVPIMASSSSSSATTLRESPTTLFHSGAFWRRKRRSVCCGCDAGGYCVCAAVCATHLETPAVVPAKEDNPMCKLGTLCVEPKRLSVRKRTLVGCGAHRPSDTQSELFSLKCTELQCYVKPLSSILRGLRSGRYATRLSSFQESVAMDRIQRIMGVLQNPNMGGRFLSIVMKIEEMLRSWFPRIKPNQANDSSPAKKQKRTAPWPPASLCSSDGESATSGSFIHVGRPHTSPICSRERSDSTLSPQSPSRGVTQDNFVSSSTDSAVLPPRRPRGPPRHLSQGPLPFKISSPYLERLLKAKKSTLTPRGDDREARCRGYSCGSDT
ncbi:uncharacterized protein LOC133395797 [Phycodurus eques]|uniref:uncharacterized protein LOC133395797 n=1 Tax=Phycodurus eques TaxID=693459 RepID=UPI002ACDE587|nr:uncharacterized protein LOC133395797 [Phycodurus eques]